MATHRLRFDALPWESLRFVAAACRTHLAIVQLEIRRAPRFVIGNSICRQPVQLAGLGILLDLLVEDASVKFLKPGPQLGEVLLGELSDCLFYVVESRHTEMLS